MAWNDTKDTFQDRPDVPADEKITSSEWNNHTDDQENRGYVTVTTVTGNHTAATQEIVLADASGGDLTVTLPAPESAAAVTVKKISSSGNTVTVATPGAETIDGDASRTITGENVAREITSDGSNYFII